MSILTNLPATLTCGSPEIVTIDKAQLVTDFGITDAFWANPINWGEIEFYYEGQGLSGQYKKLTFAGLTSSLNMRTNFANGDWLCAKLTIKDLAGRQLQIPRADFPITTEFDFGSIGGYAVSPPNFLNSSWFDISKDQGNGEFIISMTPDDSGSFLYITADSDEYGFQEAKSQTKGMAVDLNGNIADTESNLLDDALIQSFYVDPSGLTAYVAGVFNSRYKTTTLPTPLAGQEEYLRLLKIDMVTEAITHIGDYLLSTPTGLVAGAGTVYIRSSSTVSAINESNGSVIWEKPVISSEPSLISAHTLYRLVLQGAYLYTYGYSYDSVANIGNINTILKIDITNGVQDTSYTTGYDSLPSSEGTAHSWDVNSNGTGVVARSTTDMWIFTTGVSLVTISIGASSYYCLVTNTEIFVGSKNENKPTIFRYNIAGVLINNFEVSAQTQNFTQIRGIVLNAGFIYVTIASINADYPKSEPNTKKFDSTSYAPQAFTHELVNTSILDSISIGGSNLFYGTRLLNPYVTSRCAMKGNYYGTRTLKIDMATKAVLNTSVLPLLDAGSFPTFLNPVTSPLAPDKIFKSAGGPLIVYNGIDFSVDSGWPTTGNGAPSGMAIDGGFIYLVYPTSNLASDIGGAWNGRKIFRIDLVTKLIDRTFDPVVSLLENTGIGAKLSFTDDYVYISTVKTNNQSPSNFRIKKSDNSVQLIDGVNSDIVCAGPSPTYSNHMNFRRLPSGDLLIFAQRTYSFGDGTMTLSGVSWITVNETTLATIASSAFTDKIVHAVYDDTNNKIIAHGFQGFQGSITEYNVIGDTRTIHFSEAANGPSYKENDRTSQMVLVGTSVYYPLLGWIDRKSISGIMKFSPLPTIIS